MIALDYCRPAPGVQRFTVPLAFDSPDHLHVHVIDTPDGPVLVDTGARGSEAALYDGLERLDAEPAAVLVTHGHIDHWGLARLIADRVLAHPGVEPTFAFVSDRAVPEGLPGGAELAVVFDAFTRLARGVPAIDPIGDGDRIGDWTVLWTPGHDPGHVCLFRESDGVLLCGDLLLPGFTPNVQPGWADGSDALADFLDAVERVGQLPVSLVLPAHGEPYTDAARRARQLLLHHDGRLNELRIALGDGVRDLAALRDRIFNPALNTSEDRMLSSMETYAHLDHLRNLGEAQCDVDGLWTAKEPVT